MVRNIFPRSLSTSCPNMFRSGWTGYQGRQMLLGFLKSHFLAFGCINKSRVNCISELDRSFAFRTWYMFMKFNCNYSVKYDTLTVVYLTLHLLKLPINLQNMEHASLTLLQLICPTFWSSLPQRVIRRLLYKFLYCESSLWNYYLKRWIELFFAA